MNGYGKSDRPIVAERRPNKDWDASQCAEGVEPRGLAKGNSFKQNRIRAQYRGRSRYGRP